MAKQTVHLASSSTDPAPTSYSDCWSAAVDGDDGSVLTEEQRARCDLIIGVFLKQYLVNPDAKMLQSALMQGEQASAEGGDFMEPFINMLRVLSIDKKFCEATGVRCNKKKKKKKNKKGAAVE